MTAAKESWLREAVIYEAYLRSFRDASGDGVGDLKGLCEKLDYIASLGVDALWVSPFYPSPQKDFGYDVTDLRGVDPSAGTMEDFMAVLDGAHERGLKLLLDFIPGHTSDEHPWFVESRSSRDNDKADWYVWVDKKADGSAPTNWLSSFGGPAWQWEPRRGQYYYHPFFDCQPALNLRNPVVLRELQDEMRFWLELGVDGVRIDAVQCLTYDPDLRDNPPTSAGEKNKLLISGSPESPFNAQMHLFDRNVPGTGDVVAALRSTADEFGAVVIGELADVDSIVAARELTEGPEALHAVYDFALVNAGADSELVSDVLRRRHEALGEGWLYNVFTNHDAWRAVSDHYTVEGNRPQAARMLLFMQLTLRGGCIIYQGEELALPHPELSYDELQDPWAKAFWPAFEGRDAVRTPMPWTGAEPHAGFTEAAESWSKVPDAHRQLNVAAQSDDPSSVLNFLRDFTAWRKDQDVLRKGDESFDVDRRNPLVTWRRMHGDEDWQMVVNFSESRAFLPLDAEAALVPAPGCVHERTEHGLPLEALEFAIVRR